MSDLEEKVEVKVMERELDLIIEITRMIAEIDAQMAREGAQRIEAFYMGWNAAKTNQHPDSCPYTDKILWTYFAKGYEAYRQLEKVEQTENLGA